MVCILHSMARQSPGLPRIRPSNSTQRDRCQLEYIDNSISCIESLDGRTGMIRNNRHSICTVKSCCMGTDQHAIGLRFYKLCTNNSPPSPVQPQNETLLS